MPALRRIIMKKFKIWLLNKALSHLFPVFEMDRVFTADKQGHLFLNGELVTDKQKGSLKGEVRMFKNTQIWDILSASLKYQAQKLAFNESKDLQDLLNAKMVLWTISVQEGILKKIEESK